MTLTRKQWIYKATKKHQGRYYYDHAFYEHSHLPVLIRCPKHGIFKQIACRHLRGDGCRKCADDKKRGTTEGFIKKARAVHGDFYGYEYVEYINKLTPVIIRCPRHGPFEKTPESHIMRKEGCGRCTLEKKASKL